MVDGPLFEIVRSRCGNSRKWPKMAETDGGYYIAQSPEKTVCHELGNVRGFARHNI